MKNEILGGGNNGDQDSRSTMIADASMVMAVEHLRRIADALEVIAVVLREHFDLTGSPQ